MQNDISCKAVNKNAIICQTRSYVEDVDGWLSSNKLKFVAYDKKRVYLAQQLLKVTHRYLDVNGVSVAPVSSP